MREPCDFPWCQEPAQPLRVNAMRVCRLDLQFWLDLYHMDAMKGLYDED